MRSSFRTVALSLLANGGLALVAVAQDADRLPASLTYIPGSSVKIEQVTGDFDYAAAVDYANPQAYLPTVSQTATRFHVAGNGLGYSFEHEGKLIFLFGDTISEDPVNLNYHAADPIAWSATKDGEAGLLVNYYTQADGLPLFIEPSDLNGQRITMGADQIANSGISVEDRIYLVCNTGADPSLPDPHIADRSVLVRFDEDSQTFSTLRQLSALDPTLAPDSRRQGHFIFTSPHRYHDDVLVFGVGHFRASDIYLAKVPARNFADGAGTHYLVGVDQGQPVWSDQESDAQPIVFDNPPGGPAQNPWPHDNPTIGNVSVQFVPELGLWLMTFDGGRQQSPNKDATTGIYFCYAAQPWGPWSTPQQIFNGTRDRGFGVFMSNYDPHNPNVPGTPAGPTIGDGDLNSPGDDNPSIDSDNDNDPHSTRGGEFAALMIGRFTRVEGNVLTIYYTMSTWNPYTVIKMRSDFAITWPTRDRDDAGDGGSQ